MTSMEISCLLAGIALAVVVVYLALVLGTAE